MPPVLATAGLVVGHGGRALLPPIDLAIAPGSRWALVGRNGSGKSTLLRTCLGLLPPVAGRVERPAPGGMAYVAQRHPFDEVVPMRAVDLVAQGLEAGWGFLRPRRRAGDRVGRAIARAGAEGFADRRFSDLSEGQKQRVMLARAIVSEPALLVLDEPSSAMDVVASADTLAVLAGLAAEAGTAILLVSHHVASAVAFAERLVFVDAEAGVAAAGPVAEVAALPRFRAHFGAVVP